MDEIPFNDSAMNTRYFSADYILPVTSEAIKNGVVAVDTEGVIKGVYPPDSPHLVKKEVVRYRGVITPGFVNAHCHLELSHIIGVIPRHTGLVSFLTQVMSTREATESVIQQAMEAADKQMIANGIVAVGDHANRSLSAAIKRRSRIHYHTFVEVIGIEADLASQKMESARAQAKCFNDGEVSLTAHAPYSVSKPLFTSLDEETFFHRKPLSIHNQESAAENEFFQHGTGDFLAFYSALNKSVSHVATRGVNSLQTYLPYLSVNTSLLLVHNTFTSPEDIGFAAHRKIVWCFCLNANMYIEGTLPDVIEFVRRGQRIALGTDSLASNDRLCILSELKTLHAHFPELPLTESIRWATINGADALGISMRYGSLEIGKKPGLNLLSRTDGLALTPETTVRPLLS